MQTYAKMSSGPEPLRQHGSRGRHTKASGSPELAPPGLDPGGSTPAEGTGDEPDLPERGEPGVAPLPRRVAGQSGVVAYPSGPPGVIRPARVSGGPPWEPAPKPPDMSYAPRHHQEG
jgi:hypothetical protein